VAENQISLNRAVRERELAEADQIQKARNEERRARFMKIAEEDRKTMTFFKLSLDDVDNENPMVAYDPTEEEGAYMRRAKNEAEDLDDTPKWPSNLDPVKRESLLVLKDLVDLSENARLAGLSGNNPEIR
jgi:carboxyl-terminal processing protease